MLNFFKNVVWYIACKIKFIGSHIAFEARVNLSSTIETNSTIGKNTIIKDSYIGKSTKINKSCFISESTIGNKIDIKSQTTVTNSTLDNHVVVYSNCTLSHVNIGRFSYIAQNSQLNLVDLGRFCSIGPYLICGYGNHPIDFVSTSPIFYSTLKQCNITFTERNHFEERKKIIIGNDVWIGARVFIKDGVKIGNGAVIAAGAVVIKDVPDYAIVGGVPAKIIRFRFADNDIQSLLSIQWWNWSKYLLFEAQPYFAQNNIHDFIEWSQTKVLKNQDFFERKPSYSQAVKN